VVGRARTKDEQSSSDRRARKVKTKGTVVVAVAQDARPALSPRELSRCSTLVPEVHRAPPACAVQLRACGCDRWQQPSWLYSISGIALSAQRPAWAARRHLCPPDFGIASRLAPPRPAPGRPGAGVLVRWHWPSIHLRSSPFTGALLGLRFSAICFGCSVLLAPC